MRSPPEGPTRAKARAPGAGPPAPLQAAQRQPPALPSPAVDRDPDNTPMASPSERRVYPAPGAELARKKKEQEKDEPLTFCDSGFTRTLGVMGFVFPAVFSSVRKSTSAPGRPGFIDAAREYFASSRGVSQA